MCDNSKNKDNTAGEFSRRDFITKTAAAVSLMSMPGLLHAAASEFQETEDGEIDAIGYGTRGGTEPLKPFKFKRRKLLDNDILIEISHCGVCCSDVHSTHNTYDYTLVPGHEIVGKVSAVGKSVTKFKVGDTAGIGCMIGSCGECDNCKNDMQQYCSNGGFTFVASKGNDDVVNYGGYSNKIVVTEKFAIKIPKNINPADAAPLLCAGITTFSPMERWEIGKGKKVAVLGLGGLGHIAVKLFKARGAEVTVFTTSESKIADALKMGAVSVHLWSDKNAFEINKSKFDYILSTVPDAFDADPFIPLLKLDGTFINVGVLGEMKFNNMGLAFGRKRLTSSLAGGLKETQRLINYCADNNIKPDVELIPITQINEAWQNVLDKKVRYRYVIDMKTLS